MLRIKKLDHVAVCVPDLDAALARYEALLGVKGESREASAELATEAVLLPIGEGNIELVAPHGEGGALARFLEKKGPGLHHVALEVEGLDAAIALLKALGVTLVDDTPRIGARGHRVAFIHPRATGGLLVELVEPAPGSRGERA